MQGSPNTRSLFGSVVSYGAASSATLAAVFLLHIIAGRFLGVADYGHFSFALALTTLLAPLLDPGLYYLTIKDVARDTSKASTYLAHALTWKLAFGPFYLGIACTIAYFIHESESSVQTVALLASAVVLHSLKDCFRSTLLALENFRLDAISLGIERLSLLLVAGALLLNGFGLLALCIGYVTVRFLDLIVISRFLTPYVRIRIGTGRQNLALKK